MEDKQVICSKCKLGYDGNYYKSCPECNLNKMKTIKELEAEKDFIILRASNYHYDLGIQHEKERVLKLIDEWFSKRLVNVDWSELKARIEKNDNRD